MEKEKVTKEELLKLAAESHVLNNQYSLDQGWKPCFDKRIIEVSLQEYWDNLWSDTAKFGPKEYGKKVDHKEVQVEKWSINQATGKRVRVVKNIVPVKGVPFCSQTRTVQSQEITNQTDTLIAIEATIESLDTPYNDTFRVCECWIALTTDPEQERCVFIKLM